MSGTDIAHYFYLLILDFHKKFSKVGAIITPILEVRKLSHLNVKRLARGTSR